MSDRPIIFSAPMVRALLDGRKTQTRRVLKPQPSKPWGSALQDGQRWWTGDSLTGEVIEEWRLPYAPGDRLYVREAHKLIDRHCDYRADWPEATQHLFRWRTSIHMPRWASRLTLTVTDVRFQRLQDISEADAVAEGVDAVTMDDVPRQASMSHRSDFAALWNSLHGPDAWDSNPWVVALTFAVQHGNIDNA